MEHIARDDGSKAVMDVLQSGGDIEKPSKPRQTPADLKIGRDGIRGFNPSGFYSEDAKKLQNAFDAEWAEEKGKWEIRMQVLEAERAVALEAARLEKKRLSSRRRNEIYWKIHDCSLD